MRDTKRVKYLGRFPCRVSAYRARGPAGVFRMLADGARGSVVVSDIPDWRVWIVDIGLSYTRLYALCDMHR